MENIYWKKSVGSLIGAIWLYTLADIAGSVTGFVNGWLSSGGVMGMIASMMGEDGGSPFGLGDLLEYLFPLLVLLGYWLFYSSLTGFMRLQRSDADREAVAKVRKSYVLMLVAILVGYLWIPGKIAALVLVIVAYVKMLSGYRGLKRSETFPEEARRGAGLLFASTVWLLVGYVLGMIPFVGGAIESVIGIVVFFCVLAGWGRIRRGAPVLDEAEAAELARADAATVKKSLVPAWWFPVYVGVFLLSSIIRFSLHMEWIPGRIWSFGHPYFGTATLELVSEICSAVCLLSLLGACWFLLCSKKAALSSLSRIGLILMAGSYILQLLVSYLPWLIPFSSEMPLGDYYQLRAYLLMALQGIAIVGILLLVWNTLTGLAVKISLTVYEASGIAATFLFALWWSWAFERFPEDFDAAHHFAYLLNSSFLLAVNVLTFAAVLIGTFCRQRKRAAELPTE